MEGSLPLRRRNMYKDFNELTIMAKEGDVRSIDLLLKELYPLIISSIKRYYYRVEEFDDLLQEGRLVVLECLKTYDPSKGTHFLGYVKHMLMYYYLDKHKTKYILSLNEKLGHEDDLELMDLLESDEEDLLAILIRHEENQTLYAALDELTRRQRDIIVDFYCGDLSIKQIAKKYDISYRTVVNTKIVALNKLKMLLS